MELLLAQQLGDAPPVKKLMLGQHLAGAPAITLMVSSIFSRGSRNTASTPISWCASNIFILLMHQ
jgi:hypothetical protein